ncbi:hypothetical protein [Microbacterium sp. p3-SID131]|uniref:hypothetical protein n=1 Tax=Microbacterium sp. p3-SID131 TaxID=2916215 RepID=UPI0021A31CA6|nr:hypothetical protein [Microbacterium sp. p3-SID131]MCT1363934.1 hypothetical protein [Microbacterium sp. p3-SID131]
MSLYSIEAQRPGQCASCDHGIRAGQQIRPRNPDEGGYGGGWEHVTCPAAPTVCPTCFTEVARNGACMCGAVGA